MKNPITPKTREQLGEDFYSGKLFQIQDIEELKSYLQAASQVAATPSQSGIAAWAGLGETLRHLIESRQAAQSQKKNLRWTKAAAIAAIFAALPTVLAIYRWSDKLLQIVRHRVNSPASESITPQQSPSEASPAIFMPRPAQEQTQPKPSP
jgi:hypothetical protein